MIYFCTTVGTHVISASIEGLLIRGIPENTIFELEAESRWEAGLKAADIIDQNNKEQAID